MDDVDEKIKVSVACGVGGGLKKSGPSRDKDRARENVLII